MVDATELDGQQMQLMLLDDKERSWKFQSMHCNLGGNFEACKWTKYLFKLIINDVLDHDCKIKIPLYQPIK